MTIISLSIPEDLLKKIDRYTELRGYASRSELIRELIREYIESTEDISPSEEVTAIVIILTDHDESLSVDDKVINTVHRYQPLIKAFYHQLLSGSLCLNIAIVEGNPVIFSSLVKSLRSLRGVRRVWTLYLPIGR